MPYQSKTYSLSNEVIAAIEAARERGLTPNKYLLQLIRLDDNNAEFPPLNINDAVTRDRQRRKQQPRSYIELTHKRDDMPDSRERIPAKTREIRAKGDEKR